MDRGSWILCLRWLRPNKHCLCIGPAVVFSQLDRSTSQQLQIALYMWTRKVFWHRLTTPMRYTGMDVTEHGETFRNTHFLPARAIRRLACCLCIGPAAASGDRPYAPDVYAGFR